MMRRLFFFFVQNDTVLGFNLWFLPKFNLVLQLLIASLIDLKLLI